MKKLAILTFGIMTLLYSVSYSAGMRKWGNMRNEVEGVAIAQSTNTLNSSILEVKRSTITAGVDVPTMEQYNATAISTGTINNRFLSVASDTTTINSNLITIQVSTVTAGIQVPSMSQYNDTAISTGIINNRMDNISIDTTTIGINLSNEILDSQTRDSSIREDVSQSTNTLNSLISDRQIHSSNLDDITNGYAGNVAVGSATIARSLLSGNYNIPNSTFTAYSLNASTATISKLLVTSRLDAPGVSASGVLSLTDVNYASLNFGNHKLRINTQMSNNKLQWLLYNSYRGVMIGEMDWQSNAYDWTANPADPTLRLYSHTNPDTDNTQYGEMYHDTNNFILNAGKGGIKTTDNLYVSNGATITATGVGTFAGNVTAPAFFGNVSGCTGFPSVSVTTGDVAGMDLYTPTTVLEAEYASRADVAESTTTIISSMLTKTIADGLYQPILQEGSTIHIYVDYSSNAGHLEGYDSSYFATDSNLLNEISSRTALGLSVSESTTTLDATHVKKSGDTMTGDLTAPDIYLTYGMSATTGTFSESITAPEFIGVASTATTALTLEGHASEYFISSDSTSATYQYKLVEGETYHIVVDSANYALNGGGSFDSTKPLYLSNEDVGGQYEGSVGGAAIMTLNNPNTEEGVANATLCFSISGTTVAVLAAGNWNDSIYWGTPSGCGLRTDQYGRLILGAYLYPYGPDTDIGFYCPVGSIQTPYGVIASTLQVTTGAGEGKIAVSDSVGNMKWTNSELINIGSATYSSTLEGYGSAYFVSADSVSTTYVPRATFSEAPDTWVQNAWHSTSSDDASLFDHHDPDYFLSASSAAETYQYKLVEGETYHIVVDSANYAINGGLDSLPIGSIIAYVSTSTIPADFLYCNGAAVSRTTYASLFAVIGTQFGAGDGSTTFNVPELRGSFLRGLDNGRGWDTESGRVIGSTETDTMQGHMHSYTGTAYQLQSTAGSNSSFIASGGSGYVGGINFSIGNPSADGTNGTPRTGAETRPKNTAVAYIIKYQLSTQTQGAQNPDTVWKVIYSTTVATATDSFIISGLDSSIEKSYQLEVVKDSATTAMVFLYVNGDTTQTNYVSQDMLAYGGDTLTGSYNQSPFLMLGDEGYTSSAHVNMSISNSGIFSYNALSQKDSGGASGSLQIRAIAGSKIAPIAKLTSITLGSNQATGIGVGTTIRLMALSTSTVSVGVASQLASNTNAVIQADQDRTGDGNVVIKVGTTTMVTASETSVTINNLNIASGGAAVFNAIMPVGFEFQCGVSTVPPAGYNVLFENGQSVSTTTYAALFEYIAAGHGGNGYYFGGTGANFNIPDCRGYAPRGIDMGAGRDTETYRVIGSTETDTFQGHEHLTNLARSDISGTDWYVTLTQTSAGGGRETVGIQDKAGYDAARYSKETRMKNRAVAYFIKY